MDANVEQQVKVFAVTRIALGASFALAPGWGLRTWLGPGADSASARLALRMVGGRDLALGIGALLAVRHGAPTRGWIEAGSLADASDFAACLVAVARPSGLARGRALASGLSAAAASAYGRRLATLTTTSPDGTVP